MSFLNLDLTEKEVLIQKLIETEDTIKPDNNLSLRRAWGKQKSENHRGERTDSNDQPTTSGRKRCARRIVDIMGENANAEWELGQQELVIEQKSRKNGKKRCKLHCMLFQQHFIFYFFQIKNTTCPRIAYG